MYNTWSEFRYRNKSWYTKISVETYLLNYKQIKFAESEYIIVF